MLKQRLLTAAVLIPVVVAAVLWLPPAWFAVLMIAVTAVAAMEWAVLAGLETIPGRAGMVTSVVVVCVIGTWWQPALAYSAAVIVLPGWLAGLAAVVAYERGVFQSPGERNGMAIIGLLVLVPAALSLIRLQSVPGSGPYWVLFLFVLIWTADSAAYFAGRRWGRRPLAPRVSPGKTMAGLLGALAAALVLGAGVVMAMEMSPGVSMGFMLLVVMTVLISVLGDLVESLVKRLAGVKDSGNSLPGHGGLLDRIDSLVAAAPLFLIGLWLLGMSG